MPESSKGSEAKQSQTAKCEHNKLLDVSMTIDSKSSINVGADCIPAQPFIFHSTLEIF